jgi:GNAT superfamily N-acetyltransferase
VRSDLHDRFCLSLMTWFGSPIIGISRQDYLAIPDVNEILADLNGRLWPIGIFKFLARRSRIAAVRVVAFGVLPKYRALGIETALIHKVRSRILAKPYRHVEFSVVMENNVRMRRVLEAIGFALSKRYRLYRKDI